MFLDRRPLDARAVGSITLLTMLWGFQQVAIKLAATDVSLVMQAGIRSIAATVLLLIWASARRVPLLQRDGTLPSGLVAGALFAGEFVFIYAGLGYTAASRMIVFVYTAPCFTALMLALFVPSERLRLLQWAGVVLAFGGIITAFAEGFSAAQGETFVGDLCGVVAAFLWAATTVLIRATKLAHTSATKTLLYQLAVSAIALPLVSAATGERGIMSVTALAVASLVYQSGVVAFASYLVWFWLLTRYYAARLAVFTFLTPLFGVMFGVVFLSEHITVAFVAAAVLVAAGIALVNTPVKRWT